MSSHGPLGISFKGKLLTQFGLRCSVLDNSNCRQSCRLLHTWSHPTGRGSQTPTSFLQPLFGSILGRNFALSCELTGARSQKNILTWELTLFLYCLTLWWRSASSQKNAFFTNASFLEWFSANYGTWVNVCWVCASGLSELLPHYSLFFPIIDPVLFTFWKM